MKLRLYLDTSVFSAYLDDRTPERQRETREFWERLGEFDVGTSEVTHGEVRAVPDPDLRRRLLELLSLATMYPLTEDMEALAQEYIAAGVFPERMRADARHVAAAVLTGHDVLVSWNFRHLVNRRRRAAVNGLNASIELAQIEIVAPAEL